jgi:hypothetical protein
MNGAVFIGFAGLGLSVVLHVIFVSMTLGTGLLAALYRWRAYGENDAWAELFARKVFKVLIVSELFSGVWGTIITRKQRHADRHRSCCLKTQQRDIKHGYPWPCTRPYQRTRTIPAPIIAAQPWITLAPLLTPSLEPSKT